MAVFVIFRVTDPLAMATALKNVFPTDHLQVHGDEWLVSATGTAKDVSDRLGLTESKMGSAIVFSMANYYGRATTEIWDWIRAKAEMPGG